MRKFDGFGRDERLCQGQVSRTGRRLLAQIATTVVVILVAIFNGALPVRAAPGDGTGAPAKSVNAAKTAAELPWQLLDSEDGVNVYRRDVPGTNLFEFRGVGLVAAEIPKIVALLADPNQMPFWIDGCVKGKLLVKSFNDNDYNKAPVDYYEVAYGENSAPWPLQNRDYVLKSSVRFVPAGAGRPAHVNVHSETVIDPNAPELTDLVRIQLMRTNLDLTSVAAQNGHAAATEVDFSVVMDPGGILPDAIINLVTRTLPRKTVASLAELVRTQQYNRALEKLVSYHYEHSIQLAH